MSSRSVILLLAIASCAAAGFADVIHLKNGRRIWADSVREEGTHVRYEVGDNSYAIPKASVERIEEGGVPPEFRSSSTTDKAEVPSFVPNDELRAEGDLPAKVIRDGHVDNDSLASLEHTAKPEIAAAAYFIAGKHEFESGNLPQGRAYFDSALRLQPNSPTILNYYAALLVRMGSLKQALSYAQRSAQLAPNSADEPKAEKFSLAKATTFLDTAALSWTKERGCFTCHTNYAYLYARPAISADAPEHRIIREQAELLVTERWPTEGLRWKGAEAITTAVA